MAVTDASQYYVGKSGEDYYVHRRSNRTQDVQEYSAQAFRPHISPSDTVLDFGCGTGGILKNIPCGRRLGVEINEASVAEARGAGIAVFSDLALIKSESVDVAITHHALEHVAEPHTVLLHLLRIVRPGGKLIVAVPAEPPRARKFRTWRPVNDVHLYSWSPLTLGNLLTACGFTVQKAVVQSGGYSRYNRWLVRLPIVFRIAEKSVAYALGRFSTVCIAQKPTDPDLHG
jgi:SAM-dependent methyltransferase